MPSEALPVDLREISRILWRRRWLMILPWAVAVLAGVVAAFLLPPVYFSTVTLLLQQPQQLVGSLGGVVSGGANAEQQADVMREQVKSSLFLNSVITATGIRSDAAARTWAKQRARRYAGLTEDESIDQFLINYLRDAVIIRRGKGNVFQITVADMNRDRARRLAEGVANQFVSSSKAEQLEAVRQTQEFSIGQQAVYKRQVDDAEARLEAFQRNVLSSNMTGSSVTQANVARAKTVLDQAGFEADDLRQRMEAVKNRLEGKARPNDARQLSDGQVNSLSGQIVALERQVASAQLNEGSGDNTGGLRLAIVRKQAELEVELGVNASRSFPTMPASTRDLLVQQRQLEADLAGVEARRAWIAGQVGNFQQSVVQSPDREIERQRLSQDVENKRSLYNSFLQQSAIAQIAEAFQNAKVSGHFVILEPATRPLAPGKPNRPVLILLSLVAGAIIGAGTVLVVEYHDQSVRNADEVESLLGLPVLGAVPRVQELARSRRRGRPGHAVVGVPASREHGLLHRLKVESPLGLEFRRTYLKLAKSRSRQLPRSIVVTSATRGEGKTTTSACLAITLARELRQKVLLVDFDLRSPALHRALGLPTSSWGLAQMLHQRHFDERFVRATVLPHLEFLPAGKSERPASELIDIEGAEWFIKEAVSRYPIVVIDSAPNLAVPDPLVLGRAVEGVLYVVKAGTTIRKAAEYGVRVQREARDNVLGVLINDAGEILPHYYGYRYNYYGYTTEAAGTDS